MSLVLGPWSVAFVNVLFELRVFLAFWPFFRPELKCSKKLQVAQLCILLLSNWVQTIILFSTTTIIMIISIYNKIKDQEK